MSSSVYETVSEFGNGPCFGDLEKEGKLEKRYIIEDDGNASITIWKNVSHEVIFFRRATDDTVAKLYPGAEYGVPK